MLNTKWIREPSSQNAIYCNGLCHLLLEEWIINFSFGICNLLNHGGFQVSRKPTGRCCFAGGIQVVGPAAQIPLSQKNAFFSFVLVTRRLQSHPFYRPGKLRQESHGGTCLWLYIAVSPVTCSCYCPRQSKPERGHILGWSWDMFLDANYRGQFRAWAQ